MMFKSRCNNCKEKISKKYEFCPFCGTSLKSIQEDYGFLGKEDINNTNLNLPFGFNLLMKPLMKELNKQMMELDKELKNTSGEKIKSNKNFTSFSIHIGLPGAKLVKINSIDGKKIPFKESDTDDTETFLKLPEFDSGNLLKIKNLKKEEPVTVVRRLADKVVYEISLPNVDSIKKINMVNLEEGIEIKALASDKIFSKLLKINFPLINYYLKDQKLFLEFGL